MCLLYGLNSNDNWILIESKQQKDKSIILCNLCYAYKKSLIKFILNPWGMCILIMSSYSCKSVLDIYEVLTLEA